MKTTVYFKYGAMNSGKSLELIKIAHNYRENGIDVLVIKPNIDSREKNKVFSRTGLKWEAIEAATNDPDAMLEILKQNQQEIILFEESQFFSKEVIDVIVNYAYEKQLKAIIFFGLKVDFRGELFEGSKRIIELADKLEESTSICWCGKKARQNARVVNGKVTKDGPTILIDDDKTKVEYVTLCNYHFNTGELAN